MKPITDYAPALEYGIYDSTATIVHDEPYNYPGQIPLFITGIGATLATSPCNTPCNNRETSQPWKL